jgi:hypothetical protein
LREGGAPEPVQACVAGFDLDDDEPNPIRRGANRLDVGDLYCGHARNHPDEGAVGATPSWCNAARATHISKVYIDRRTGNARISTRLHE